MGVVVMFVNFYRNTSWEQLQSRLQSMFGTVLELPIMRGVGADGCGVPPGLEAVLRHVAEGVSHYPGRDSKMPDGWEQRMRELLLEPAASAALLALQRPLPELQEDVASRLAAALADDDSVADMMAEKLTTRGGSVAPDRAGELIRWYGIAALPADVLLEGLGSLPLPADVAELVKVARPEYHVTLWHIDEQQQGQAADNKEVRAVLAAAVGQEAMVEIVSVDWNDAVVAAQVRGHMSSEG